MKKIKRLTAAFLAVMMSASLCACGTDDPAVEIDSTKNAADTVSVEDEAADSSADETAPETDSSKADEAGTGDAESSSSEKAASAEPVDEAELAEVQKVVDTYFKAIKEKDYETLLDVTDVELIYYLQNGEFGDRAQYIDCLKESVVTGDTSYADWEITSAEPASAYVKEYSDFFALMDDMAEGEAAFAENFEIDGAYAVRMKTAGSTDVSTSSDETDSINFDFNISGNYDIDMDMPIIHINGQWKCDPVVSMAMSLYNMFSDMADSLSEAE